MINDADIKKSRSIAAGLIQEGIITKPEKGFAEFFLSKAESSLQTCSALIEISKRNEVKELMIKKSYPKIE
ncbi:MAG: hypothetical protein KJ955_05185 [Nanoarchaeota archaeon]|nr:hypothetical protein [Nanoarchaeota archaeon]